MWHVFNMPGFPIRKSPDQIVCADTRSLSQLVTSFFASESLGIRRVPLFTFFSPYPFASIWGCFLFCPFFGRSRGKNVSTVVFSINFFLPICQRTIEHV